MSDNTTFGERYRRVETIGTRFVGSMFNQVVRRRFAKIQQMRGTLREVLLLPHTRTQARNAEPVEVWRR